MHGPLNVKLINDTYKTERMSIMLWDGGTKHKLYKKIEYRRVYKNTIFRLNYTTAT